MLWFGFVLKNGAHPEKKYPTWIIPRNWWVTNFCHYGGDIFSKALAGFGGSSGRVMASGSVSASVTFSGSTLPLAARFSCSFYMGLSENRENPYTQWFCWSLSLLNGYNWGYISFSDIPICPKCLLNWSLFGDNSAWFSRWLRDKLQCSWIFEIRAANMFAATLFLVFLASCIVNLYKTYRGHRECKCPLSWTYSLSSLFKGVPVSSYLKLWDLQVWRTKDCGHAVNAVLPITCLMPSYAHTFSGRFTNMKAT